MRILSAFVGMKIVGRDKGIYSMSLHLDGRTFSVSKREVHMEEEFLCMTNIALKALDDLISEITGEGSSDIKLDYYPGCVGVKETYERQNDNISISISEKLSSLGMQLTINEGEALNAVNHMQTRRMKKRRSS